MIKKVINELKDFDLTQLFFQLLAIAAAIITIYGVLMETAQQALIEQI